MARGDHVAASGRPGWRRVLLGSCACLLAVLVVGLARAAVPVGTVTNYAGSGIDFPRGIALGPDGALWFTNFANDSIGRITTDGDVTNHIGDGIDGPIRIAAGPDGALWFANFVNDSIGRITTDGHVTNYTGDGIDEPAGIAAGPDGALWFTNNASDSIGRINTFGDVSNYTDPGISQPGGIAAGPDDALWFTNNANASIGRITTDGTVTTYTGTGIAFPRGIVAGPDGALWFVNFANDSIGRITTDGTVTNYTEPGIDNPAGIAVGPDGALWFTNTGNDTIGRIQAVPDADGDGIDDTIDTGPNTFQDDATTAGTIGTTPGGLTVTVTDLPDPAGVRVIVTGTGSAKVEIALTNPFSATPCGTVRLGAGSDVNLTCGSITVQVVTGSAEIVLSDDTTLSVDAGEQATIEISTDGSFVVTDVSGGDGTVTLTTSGGSTEIGPSATPITLWDFVGFAPPIVNGAAFNVVKAGSTVPLKWRLLDESGAPATDLASVSASLAAVDCVSGLPTGPVAGVAPSALKLQNLGDGYYNVSWTTAKSSTGCNALRLALAGEGPVTHDALVTFR